MKTNMFPRQLGRIGLAVGILSVAALATACNTTPLNSVAASQQSPQAAPPQPTVDQPAPRQPIAQVPSPEADATATAGQQVAQGTPQTTIVDVAAANPSFSTLVQAVQAAGLVETLSGEGPFTVFAPSNEAFAALPAGTLENLLRPENRDVLQKVLTYHVIPGAFASTNLQSVDVATVEGNIIAIRVSDGQIRVNNSNVIAADVTASNGIIHAINHVLLPPGI